MAIRNRAYRTKDIGSHVKPTEAVMPNYIGPINIDAQMAAIGNRLGVIVMGLPNAGVIGLWDGANWLAYDVFDWAFLQTPPSLKSGHVDIQIMDVPHLTFVAGPHKGELLDSYVTTEQVITAAFRASSLAKLTKTTQVLQPA